MNSFAIGSPSGRASCGIRVDESLDCIVALATAKSTSGGCRTASVARSPKLFARRVVQPSVGCLPRLVAGLITARETWPAIGGQSVCFMGVFVNFMVDRLASTPRHRPARCSQVRATLSFSLRTLDHVELLTGLRRAPTRANCLGPFWIAARSRGHGGVDGRRTRHRADPRSPSPMRRAAADHHLVADRADSDSGNRPRRRRFVGGRRRRSTDRTRSSRSKSPSSRSATPRCFFCWGACSSAGQ